MNLSNSIDLNEYISQSRKRLKLILDKLEWSEEDTIKDFNTNSVASSVKQRLKTTRSPIKATYPDSCITKNSLVLESSKLQEILQSSEVKAPCNFRELQENFSREQKLKIYDHVIQNTEKLANVTIEREVEGETSLADILAQKKREDKRKKRRFRKSKPTHIEEVRCLVDIQMQALEQFMENKIKKEKEIVWQSGNTKREEKRSRDKIKRFDDDYRSKESREQFTGHHKEHKNVKKRHRSRSKEHIRRKDKRHERSSSKDTSYTRKRHAKSRSRERRKRCRSSSNEIRHDVPKYESYSRVDSDERRKRRSRSNERRSRSHKDISNERKKHRSRSLNRNKSQEFSDYEKYTNVRGYEKHVQKEKSNYDASCKYSNEKYEKRSSKTSIAARQQSIGETRNSDDGYKRTNTNLSFGGDKCKDLYERSLNSKSSQQEKKKQKRS